MYTKHVLVTFLMGATLASEGCLEESSTNESEAVRHAVSENSFESYNHPGYYIRHQNYLGELTPISSALDRPDARFILVPGLAEPNCQSFQSYNLPGYYLRHQDFRIKLSPYSDDSLYKHDATFCVRPGLANPTFASFESENFPGFYIRHQNLHLYIAQGNDDLFKADATFKIEPPL